MPEAGFPTLTTGAWTAILAPLSTPHDIIVKVNKATNEALNAEPMKSTLVKLGAQPRGGSPEDLAAHLKSEQAKWTPIVASLHLKAD